jgi:TPR repeat protein
MRIRIVISLVLAIIGITSSACAKSKPPVEIDHTRAKNEAAAQEVRKLAEEGNAAAQNKLGLFYKVGKGVTQNYGQAKRWFEEAAKQGHAEAQINLGSLYLQGDAPPQSPHMALFWFGRAAEQGVVPAFAKLGQMYQEGQGVPQDFVQAYMWFHLAATNGEAPSAERRHMLATKMTQDQIMQAEKLAREWKPTSRSVVRKTLEPGQRISSNY